ncbi:MAG: hypothetical protein ACYCXN_01320 [Acidimicrobiales bacterium]|jgi:hypothetical protein
MSIDPDWVNRTAKILTDSGEVSSLDDAEAVLSTYVLQLQVGTEVATNRTLQAAVLTAVNAGARAFLGGVRVRLSADPVVNIGWDAGRRLSEAVAEHGGTIVDTLFGDVPTICFGDAPADVPGERVLRATFDGWTAGVVEGRHTPLAERDLFVPAGVAAAGIAVAEAFQLRRGDVRAGRRDQGVSLWRPDVRWLATDAIGPDEVAIAPREWWLIGLGHLGQAYLWTIGLLPYAKPDDVSLMLQDDDHATKANESTGLLVPRGWRGRKTRALATIAEDHGFATAITERRFAPGQGPAGDEPRLALVGVDNPETRRQLSDAGFAAVVDAGLGAGPVDYLAIQTRVFPAGRRSDEVPGWQQRPVPDAGLLELPAYKDMATENECGTIQIAGRSVAAAFVGAVASALVVAEAVRLLLGECRYALIDAHLRDLTGINVVAAADNAPLYPGFARLR